MGASLCLPPEASRTRAGLPRQICFSALLRSPVSVIQAVEPILPPPIATARFVQHDFRISSRRQMHLQPAQPPAAPAQRQPVLPGRQEREDDLSPAEQRAFPAAAPLPLFQQQAVHEAGVPHPHPQGTPGISGEKAQAAVRFPARAKAEASGDGQRVFYCSSLALTRYCPPVTPPNRYFPSALVLVVAISVSTVTPPTWVT